MRRLLLALPIAVLLLWGLSIPAPAYAAVDLPILNPNFTIVPADCLHCPCTFSEVLALAQNLINAGIAIGIIAAVLVIVYSGAMFMLNPTQPEARSNARKMFTNVVVGLVIVLAAWLVVDFIMKTIYVGEAGGNANYGPWNSILGDNINEGPCIIAQPVHQIANPVAGIVGGIFTPNGPGTLPSGPAGSSCDPAAVQQAAAAGGTSISSQEANILACLAKPESTCGNNTTGAHTSSGQPTSAAGPWQVLIGAPDTCHSLNLPACGNLNCSAAYSGGRVKSDAASQQLAQRCLQAANTLTCSVAAAACLVQKDHGTYSDWTLIGSPRGDGYSHAAQRACVGQ